MTRLKALYLSALAAVPWWAAGLVANASIVCTEYLNRTRGAEGWLAVLPYTLPFIVVSQWGLFQSWRGAPTMMMAWLCFTLGNNVLRLLSSYFWLRETFDWRVPLGCAVMFAGSLLVKAGTGK